MLESVLISVGMHLAGIFSRYHGMGSYSRGAFTGVYCRVAAYHTRATLGRQWYLSHHIITRVSHRFNFFHAA